MDDQELARYFELVGKMKAGTLDQTKCEHVELKALGEKYATHLRVKQEQERDEGEKVRLEALRKRQAEDEAERAEQATGHQLSWLKSVLNPKIPDEKLAALWAEFRAAVEG